MSTTNEKSRERRRRVPREQIEAILAQYRDSGMTQSAFAKRAGVKICNLRNWLYSKRRRESQEETPGFATVKLRGSTLVAGSVTIRWPGGVEVELSSGMDALCMMRVVRELVRTCSA
ncbi:MAG: transposase [Opitutaceae bacterium]|jgi:transposase-like protein